MVVVLVQACRWCWVLLIICGWCCWVLDIGHLCCRWSSVTIGFQSSFVHCCCLLFIVVCHCASFIGVVDIQRHFVSCGDMAADMSVGLPIVEGQ